MKCAEMPRVSSLFILESKGEREKKRKGGEGKGGEGWEEKEREKRRIKKGGEGKGGDRKGG